MTQRTQNGPLETLRDGFLKVTLWRNDGEKGPYFTASFSKTYEKDGELHDGHSFHSSDLLAISELARQAYAKIRRHRTSVGKERAGNPEP
ncbi:hypothetical protein JIN85_15255 [Luteolibacter pohnpeiensis]|uniref:Uncharacterized protein n=1 Tax=Luteolibacter pohnpeiensis TaxID=454153 RepID=A0A934VWY8_9BACT|nr:hypothetical protein [Luteolibacter pohnpeiensis]MBK1883775.1 hypothetical protein [Luteolibacter pohnpeiensis]